MTSEVEDCMHMRDMHSSDAIYSRSNSGLEIKLYLVNARAGRGDRMYPRPFTISHMWTKPKGSIANNRRRNIV